MTHVLVTGADGFIGSHLVEQLVREGHEVRAFVQYNSFGSWGWLDRCPADIMTSIEVVAGDVRDPHGVSTAVTGCDAVLHLAALIAIPFSYNSPDSYIETNVRGTLNIVQAARAQGTSMVVHTSTSEVYGTAQYVPIDEKHPVVGQSPYSASKIGADQIAHSFYASFGVPVVTLRPFNTYGPRQSARAVIPTIITQMASGANKIKLGALSPTRDFSYVSDTVSGFVAAMAAPNAVGEVINLGSGFEISIGKTAELIAGIFGRDVAIFEDAVRRRPDKSEVERLFASNAKAKDLIGWEPKFAGLDGYKAGLKETIDWFTDDANLVRYKSDIYNV